MKPRSAKLDDTERLHAVRFYNDVAGLSRVVVEFIAKGLSNGESAVLITTPPHWNAIENELRQRGVDSAALQEDGSLTVRDAESTLATFMIDGMPDPLLFRSALEPLIATAAAGKQSVRAYGEMVDVLWKAGQTTAATRLEILWNSLRSTHAFSLLCAYSMGNFYKDAAIDEICSHHSHVMSASGDAALF